MLILPLIILGAIALPFIAGCDRVKSPFSSPACMSESKPDEFKHIDEGSWRVIRTLWPDELSRGQREPWFVKFMNGVEPNIVSMRNGLGETEAFFRMECEGKVTYERDKKHFERYHAHSTDFFRKYLSGTPNPQDNGILVLIGGFAPLDAGESAVINGINALIVPTEPRSPVREQRSELGQVFKAGYFYNAAAARAVPDSRYSIAHSRHKLGHADAKYVRANLSYVKSILDDVRVKTLTASQRVFYDILREAGKNLKKSVR